MIQALFFDLDGTLLSSTGRVTPLTQRALEACAARGIRLFAATARPPMLKEVLHRSPEAYALFSGGVYCNGGCVDVGGDRSYTPVPQAVVESVLERVHAYEKLNVVLQLEDGVHALRFPFTKEGWRMWDLKEGAALTLEQAAGKSVLKVQAFYANMVDSTTLLDEAFAESLTAGCAGEAQVFLADGGRSVMVMAKGVTKLYGVNKAREKLGLAMDEIAVFGDDVTDVAMLAACPNSVAMGNAIQAAKDAARFTTLDHDHDGIAYALEHILKLI